jgi:hypothetical protein
MPDVFCPWCERAFSPRLTGGKPQRFCSVRCRREFHAAARAWALAAIDAGTLSATMLRAALQDNAHVRYSAKVRDVGPT